MEKVFQLKNVENITYAEITTESDEKALEQAVIYFKQGQPQIKWISEEEKNSIKNVKENS